MFGILDQLVFSHNVLDKPIGSLMYSSLTHNKCTIKYFSEIPNEERVAEKWALSESLLKVKSKE